MVYVTHQNVIESLPVDKLGWKQTFMQFSVPLGVISYYVLNCKMQRIPCRHLLMDLKIQERPEASVCFFTFDQIYHSTAHRTHMRKGQTDAREYAFSIVWQT